MESSIPSGMGPYRIQSLLGRGGMGVVYSAVHGETGTRVALKTVGRGGFIGVTRFRSEIRALSRMRHPGIVRIFDHGIAEGVPWYAMELLEARAPLPELPAEDTPAVSGGTTATVPGDGYPCAPTGDSATLPGDAATGGPVDLCADTHLGESQTLVAPQADPVDLVRQSLDRVTACPRPASDRPPAAHGRVPEVLAFMRRLCGPLAHAHALGVVHRDLKPGNILFRPDGTAVVVDFGLAERFGGAGGREGLRVEQTSVSGTLGYVAPEQAAGETVDARADIYALGCILYELLVGRPPFLGDPIAVIQAHINTPPTPPSEVVSGVSAELDTLALRLLAKSRRDRIGYVEELERELAALGAPPPEDRGHDVPPPRPYLYRPDFVGRREPLRVAQEAVSAARNGNGSLLLVAGESGAGKTRFAARVARDAVRAGLETIVGECLHVGTALPGEGVTIGGALHPLRSLLLAVSDVCHAEGAGATERLLGDGGPVLAKYEPALTSVPGADAWTTPPALPPGAARLRVFRALTRTLRAFSENKPALIVLDDLQWADELTLGFLRYAAHDGLGDVRALLVGTHRLDEEREDLAALSRDATVACLTLERFGERDVGEFVSAALGTPSPPAQLVQSLARRGSGNPFRIMEYLRWALAAGALARTSEDGWRLADDTAARLPRSFLALIVERLEGLSADARGVLALAATLGREFEGDILAAATGLRELAFLDALNELVSQQIVEPLEGDRYRFQHDALREVPFAQIPPARRRELHELIAETLEARPARERTGVQRAALGHHWARAERPERAIGHLRAAGQDAASAFANGQAESFLLLARRLLEGQLAADGRGTWSDDAGAVGEELGDVLARSGAQERARESFEWALAQVAPDMPLLRARLWRKTGKTWETHHRLQEAIDAFGRAAGELERCRDDGDGAWRREFIENEMDQVWANYWFARVPEMERHIARVRPLVRTHASALQRARFHQALLNLNHRRLRYAISEDTLDHALASMAAAEETDALVPIAFARFVLGFCLLFHGDHAEAVEQLREGLEQANLVGDVTLRARFLSYLTLAHRFSGDVEQVRALATRGLATATDGGMTEYIGTAHANLAWVALRDDDPTAARRHARAAVETWSEHPNRYPFQWSALLPLLTLQVDEGALNRAIASARELIHPGSQRLPDPVATALEGAVTAFEQGAIVTADDDLRTALDRARSAGYL